MVGLGFLSLVNVPTEEAKQSLPSDLPGLTRDVDKAIVIFHDKTTFQANDDQPTLGQKKGGM